MKQPTDERRREGYEQAKNRGQVKKRNEPVSLRNFSSLAVILQFQTGFVAQKNSINPAHFCEIAPEIVNKL